MTHPIEITEADDSRVDVFRDVRDRDVRGRHGMFIAESEMVVRRLFKHPVQLHSVLLSPTKYERMHHECDALPEDIPVYVAPLAMMESIAGFHIHRGVLAAGWRPNEQDLSCERLFERLEGVERACLLAVSGVTNVDNIGGLFRTAAGLGIRELILDGDCADPLYRKAIRVSMGHVLGLPWTVSQDLSSTLNHLGDLGYSIVAAESCHGAVPLETISPADKLVIVVGSEGHGLSAGILDQADVVGEIPMQPEVPSLNVVVAAGIMMAHLCRTV